jgi:antitoxin (DNA-binding transcriptional repressor) of toxin-antitoxin stability system
LSDDLARVREGDDVVVTDRGRAVARIVAIKGNSRQVAAVLLVGREPERGRERSGR